MFPEFASHFEELRRRLIVCLLAFVLASVAAYFFSAQILDFLTRPLELSEGVQLYFHKPYEAFVIRIKAAALTGGVLCLPLFFLQAWLFTAPGLYEREKRLLAALTGCSVAFFVFGAAFAYQLVIPWGLRFLLSFQTPEMKALLGVDPYFSFLASMVVSFGLVFDFPVVIVGLTKLGILKSRTLAKARKGFVVGILILAALLTPSPDPVSQLALAIPLWILFEVSLGVSRWTERRPKRA